jgi:transglutaminase-like putative cysteine protease
MRPALVGFFVLVAASFTPAQDRAARRPEPRRPAAVAAPSADAPRRAGEFRIETHVTPPAGAQLLEMWVPAPCVEEAQAVLEASAPTPPGAVLTQETDPESGNTFLHLKVEYPAATVAFTASWTFERREEVKSRFRRGTIGEAAVDDGSSFSRDLAASKLVPVTGRIKARASLIAPGETDALNVARAIYDEVLKTVDYSTAGEGWGHGDALWALDAGHGDATDLAALFVGLARARGIPARFMMGFPLPETRADPEAEIPGYTAWAQFFVPDLGWIPVDLAQAKLHKETRQSCFGNLDERRILFTTGRDVQLAPPSKRGPHNYIIYPHAEIDGEPASVSHRFVFKEK